MAYKNNSAFIDLCITVIVWLRQRAITTHNYYVHFKEEDYAAGISCAYYKAYVLLQQQARIFLIPLKILGLSQPKEKDLLSSLPIKQKHSLPSTNIPQKHQQMIEYWMQDQVYELKEEWLRSKKLAEKEIIFAKQTSQTCSEYYRGEVNGFSEILNYICQQANIHGVSLASLNLDNLRRETSMKQDE